MKKQFPWRGAPRSEELYIAHEVGRCALMMPKHHDDYKNTKYWKLVKYSERLYGGSTWYYRDVRYFYGKTSKTRTKAS